MAANKKKKRNEGKGGVGKGEGVPAWMEVAEPFFMENAEPITLAAAHHHCGIAGPLRKCHFPETFCFSLRGFLLHECIGRAASDPCEKAAVCSFGGLNSDG